jgi:predicted ester cyclase
MLHGQGDEVVTLKRAVSKAVLFFTLSGTHEDEFMGIPATGKQVSINGMTRSYIENGQIIEEWELLDQLTMFQQLGIVSMQ